MIRPSTSADARVGTAQAVWLVARREIVTRARSKAFLITTAIMVLAIVALSIIMKFVSGHTSAKDVGFTPQNASLAKIFALSADAVGQDVNTPTVPDEATGRKEVKDGTLDALVVGAPDSIQVVVKKDINDNLKNAFTVMVRQQVLDQQITKAGGDPAEVEQAVASASVNVESLQPTHKVDSQRLALGIITGILIYLALLIYGQMVAQGVVEEKSSRVVELLLSTIRPWQLMAGKVLGIGVVGLAQMILTGVVGVIASKATGALTIGLSSAIGTVIWLIVWYLLGFFAYALVFAGLGALVSRQEDIGSVTAPVMMLIIVPYVLGISILPSDPSNHLIEVLSIIPTFAPTLMPIRLAMGGVPLWEVIASVVLVLLMIPILVALTGRIYRNAVMRSGARVRLRDALSPA